MTYQQVQVRADGMRVFITGATGFLGGALARSLAQGGAEVHALARPTADRRVLNEVDVTWHEGDVTVPESLNGAFAGAAWIIHAAGRLGEVGVPEEVYQRLNVDGTRNVLAASLAARSKPRVLHVSSPGVLGPTTPQAMAEDAPYAPSNPYERSKATAEQVAREFAARGLSVVIARPGFIYGPGDRHVLGLFKAIHRSRFFYVSGGRHFCHPTFVADAVAGMLLCLSRGRPGEVYHITGPCPVTFRELGETIATALGVRPPWLTLPRWLAMLGALGLEAFGRVTGRKPPLSRTGVAFFSEDRVFSWQKAYDELGYTPQHDLATGVAYTVAWYRQHGWL
jgi:nucleoside-diphosphate-sugar epimerase